MSSTEPYRDWRCGFPTDSGGTYVRARTAGEAARVYAAENSQSGRVLVESSAGHNSQHDVQVEVRAKSRLVEEPTP